MLDKRIDDKDQKVRVMRRVKLMLDPTGSAKGRDMPLEDIEKMTDEERGRYEGDQMMRSMGNRCLRKLIETAIMAAVVTCGLYHFGILEWGYKKMNPQLFEKPLLDIS